MKIFISVFFLLTSIVSMLILVGKKMRKPFKSCGESCYCIDEEMLGNEGSAEFKLSWRLLILITKRFQFTQKESKKNGYKFGQDQ